VKRDMFVKGQQCGVYVNLFKVIDLSLCCLWVGERLSM